MAALRRSAAGAGRESLRLSPCAAAAAADVQRRQRQSQTELLLSRQAQQQRGKYVPDQDQSQDQSACHPSAQALLHTQGRAAVGTACCALLEAYPAVELRHAAAQLALCAAVQLDTALGIVRPERRAAAVAAAAVAAAVCLRWGQCGVQTAQAGRQVQGCRAWVRGCRGCLIRRQVRCGRDGACAWQRVACWSVEHLRQLLQALRARGVVRVGALRAQHCTALADRGVGVPLLTALPSRWYWEQLQPAAAEGVAPDLHELNSPIGGQYGQAMLGCQGRVRSRCWHCLLVQTSSWVGQQTRVPAGVVSGTRAARGSGSRGACCCSAVQPSQLSLRSMHTRSLSNWGGTGPTGSQ